MWKGWLDHLNCQDFSAIHDILIIIIMIPKMFFKSWKSSNHFKPNIIDIFAAKASIEETFFYNNLSKMNLKIGQFIIRALDGRIKNKNLVEKFETKMKQNWPSFILIFYWFRILFEPIFNRTR